MVVHFLVCLAALSILTNLVMLILWEINAVQRKQDVEYILRLEGKKGLAAGRSNSLRESWNHIRELIDADTSKIGASLGELFNTSINMRFNDEQIGWINSLVFHVSKFITSERESLISSPAVEVEWDDQGGYKIIPKGKKNE